MFIVDHLLDILTGNEHRKTSHYIAEQKMLRKEDELLETTYNDLEEIEEVPEKDSEKPSGKPANSMETGKPQAIRTRKFCKYPSCQVTRNSAESHALYCPSRLMLTRLTVQKSKVSKFMNIISYTLYTSV